MQKPRHEVDLVDRLVGLVSRKKTHIIVGLLAKLVEPDAPEGGGVHILLGLPGHQRRCSPVHCLAPHLRHTACLINLMLAHIVQAFIVPAAHRLAFDLQACVTADVLHKIVHHGFLIGKPCDGFPKSHNLFPVHRIVALACAVALG